MHFALNIFIYKTNVKLMIWLAYIPSETKQIIRHKINDQKLIFKNTFIHKNHKHMLVLINSKYYNTQEI